MIKVGVLGCGHMASAVVLGMNESSLPVKFYTYTPTKTRAKSLAEEVNGELVKDLKELPEVDFLIIGCKPQQFPDLANRLKGVDLKDSVVLSLMAAVSLEKIKKLLGSQQVIRLMPSLPMKYKEGISLLFKSLSVSKESLQTVKTLLESSSLVIELENEKLFNQLTVVSASGPAYIYFIVQQLTKIVQEWGVQEDSAKKIITQLFKGATEVLEREDKPTQTLIDEVTSKKGVTIEAVESFRQDGLFDILDIGIQKAYQRSSEIETELS